MSAKEFYDEMYKDDDSSSKMKLPFLYRKLRKFGLSRYEFVYQFAPEGDSALDIGCGDGELLLLLKNKYGEVWGVDIAEPRINRIQRKLGNEPNIHVRVEDANEQLGFKDGSFDTITAIAVLEHLFDPFHCVKECHRLLVKGGTLIAKVANIAWLPNRIRLLMGKLPEAPRLEGTEWAYTHLHAFTRASLRKLFLDNGFEVVKITCGGTFAKPRRLWGSLLGGDILIVGVKR